jgi:cysteinyl-tRNA synthetase
MDKSKIDEKNALTAHNLMLDFDNVLGLKLDEVKEEKLSTEIMKLVKEREKARKDKDWAKADKIRAELNKKGIVLEDQPDGGTRWKKI